MKRFSKFIQESKLSQSQRDRLDDLILNVHMTTHPEYDGDEGPTKYLNMIRKEFGDKVAKQVNDGIEKVHWGRDNRSGGNDKLAWRKGGARITKSGKMNAQDVKALKNRIKQDKAWGGITKAVKLPEEVEQIDEISQEKLRDYHAAAGADRQKAKGEVEKIFKDKKPTPEKVQKTADAYKRFIKRGKGMTAAANKMSEEVELDEKYKDPWAAPKKGSSAWHAAQQRKKAERDPEEVKRVNAIGNKNHMVGTAKVTHNESVELNHEDLHAIAKDHDKAAQKHKTAYAETKSYAAARNHEVAYNRHADAAKAHREAANDKSKHSSEKLEKMSNHAWDATDHIRKHFDESVELDEVSDKKLDAYRQKAFADQPSGDDGSDKYRKRKFGRDLAFAKQTGRAKVLATKEEVELDEASDLRVTKVYNKFPKKATYAVHSPDRKYYKEFDTEAEAKKHLETKK